MTNNGWYVASVPAPVNSATEYQGWTPCIQWCKKQFGTTGWRFVGEGVFEFREEQDYAWFILRWS